MRQLGWSSYISWQRAPKGVRTQAKILGAEEGWVPTFAKARPNAPKAAPRGRRLTVIAQTADRGKLVQIGPLGVRY